MKIGQLVLYTYPRAEQSPGHVSQAPAIVVRVWESGKLNLRLFSDSTPHGAEWRTDVGHKNALASDDGFFERIPFNFQQQHFQEEER